MDNIKKNVWIINHYAIPPNLGGLSRHYYFSKFLTQTEKYEVSIFSSSKIHNTDINKITNGDFYKQETIMDVPYTFIKTSDYSSNGLSRIKNMLEFPFRLQKLPKYFKKPDVIYTSSPTPFTAFSAIILAKRLKVPVIVEVRDLWPESVVVYNGMSRKNPIIMVLYALEKWIYKNATKLIFTMEGGKDYIKEKKWDNKIDLSKITNINNGIDLEQFLKDKKDFNYKDVDLDNEDIFKITYAGSIRKVNNLGDVLKIAKEVKNRGLDKVRFLIFGDGNEREELIKKCEEEKIDNVIFKGKVSKEYIPSIVSKSDVNLVHVKGTDIMRFGCSLNKLFDYFASGKPIVSDLWVNYDLIKKYDCGIVTEDQQPQTVADAIEEFVNMPKDRYNQMCKNSEKVSKNYDFKVLTRYLEEVIEDVLK